MCRPRRSPGTVRDRGRLPRALAQQAQACRVRPVQHVGSGLDRCVDEGTPVVLVARPARTDQSGPAREAIRLGEREPASAALGDRPETECNAGGQRQVVGHASHDLQHRDAERPASLHLVAARFLRIARLGDADPVSLVQREIGAVSTSDKEGAAEPLGLHEPDRADGSHDD